MSRENSKRLIKLTHRHPPVSVDDLALMLEIDLAFGRRPDFVKRLRRALDAVAAVQEIADEMNEIEH